MNVIYIVISLIVAALIYLGIARETGFSVREKFGFKGWGVNFDFGFSGEWWKKKDDKDKEWFGYTVTAVIAISVSYAISAITTPKVGYVTAGVIVLVGLHAVWIFLSKKTSAFTKIFISGFLLFYVFAFAFPDIVRIRDAKVNDVKTFLANQADNAEGKPKANTGLSIAIEPTQRVPVKAVLLTSEWSKEIPLPAGKYSKGYCSQPGAEMALVYDTGQSMRVESGEAFPCPTQDESPPDLGTNVVHPRYVFRNLDGEGEITATVTSN